MQFLKINFKGREHKVWALRQGTQLWWHVGGRAWVYDFKPQRGPQLRNLGATGHSYETQKDHQDTRFKNARRQNVRHPSVARPNAGGLEAGEAVVTAPLPGKIIQVLVKEGQDVEKNQSLLVIEAMKMEHTLKAPRKGRVAPLSCKVGEQVQPGQGLLILRDAK